MNTSGMVSLRPITDEDAADIVRWRNSKEVYRTLYDQRPINIESHLKYIQANKDHCRQFIIIEDSSGKPIGTTFLKNIDFDKKEAEFGIFIGEAVARGKGFSKYATKLTCKYGFNELGLSKIKLSVMISNIPAIRTYEKAGFRFISSGKEAGYDVAYYEIEPKDLM